MNPVLKESRGSGRRRKGLPCDPEGNARGRCAARPCPRSRPSTPRATRRTSPPSATRTSPLPSTPCSSSAASTTAPSSRPARFLNGIGDSLVIGEDDEAFKVHVHTDTRASRSPRRRDTARSSLPRSRICARRPRILPRAARRRAPTIWRRTATTMPLPRRSPQELKPFGFPCRVRGRRPRRRVR